MTTGQRVKTVFACCHGEMWSSPILTITLTVHQLIYCKLTVMMRDISSRNIKPNLTLVFDLLTSEDTHTDLDDQASLALLFLFSSLIP